MATGQGDRRDRRRLEGLLDLLADPVLWEGLRFFVRRLPDGPAGAADLAAGQGWVESEGRRVAATLVGRRVLVQTGGQGVLYQVDPGSVAVASALVTVVDGVEQASPYEGRRLLEALSALLEDDDLKTVFNWARDEGGMVPAEPGAAGELDPHEPGTRRDTRARNLHSAFVRLRDSGIIELRPRPNGGTAYFIVHEVGVLRTTLRGNELLNAGFLELLSRWQATSDLETATWAQTLGFPDLPPALLTPQDAPAASTLTPNGRRVLTALEGAVAAASVSARHSLLRRLRDALQPCVLRKVARGSIDWWENREPAGELSSLGLLSRVGGRYSPAPNLSRLLAVAGFTLIANPARATAPVEPVTFDGVTLTELTGVARALLTDGDEASHTSAPSRGSVPAPEAVGTPFEEQFREWAERVRAAALAKVKAVTKDYRQLGPSQRAFVGRVLPVIPVEELTWDSDVTLPWLVAGATTIDPMSVAEAIGAVRERITVVRALWAVAGTAPAQLLDTRRLALAAGLREGALTPEAGWSGNLRGLAIAAATTVEQAAALTAAIEAASKALVHAVEDDLSRLPAPAQRLILSSFRPSVGPLSLGETPLDPTWIVDTPRTLRAAGEFVEDAQRLLALISRVDVRQLPTGRLERLVGLPEGALMAAGPSDDPGRIFATMTIPEHIARLTAAIGAELGLPPTGRPAGPAAGVESSFPETPSLTQEPPAEGAGPSGGGRGLDL